jgi:hypothetical protein
LGLYPLVEGQSPSFEQFRIPQGWFVRLNLTPWFWRKSRKCKSLQTDGRTNRRADGQTDGKSYDGQRSIRITHLRF